LEPFAPKRILAATDFSDVSTWTLRHAVLWAQRYGAHLTVLHAQEFPPIGGEPYFGSYDLSGIIQANREALSQELAAHVQHHVPPGIPVSLELLAGSPAAVIEEHAASIGADLVVLGTHGRGGVVRLLLGSVAERALRMASRPTLIVRRLPDEEESRPGAPRLRHILCPVNYTEVARAAFEHAHAVARAFRARLTVVFTVELKEAPVTVATLQRAEEELRSWLPAEAEAACQVQAVVRHGDAAEQVIRLAHEAAVDLVVIGAQHRPFFDTTVLGVTTMRVTRHALCPVLVVPRSSDAS
jgi:nucleotide-binding universal stress UspA family protein